MPPARLDSFSPPTSQPAFVVLSPVDDRTGWQSARHLTLAATLLTLLLLFLPGVLPGQIDYSLISAEQAIGSEDYRLASQILDSLEERGSVGPNFYLAQGNAHFEAGNPGRSILAYERGLRLQPANADLINNLAFVRQSAGIATPAVSEFFLIRAWRGAGALLGSTTTFILALISWWLAVAGLVWWYLRREGMEEKRRFALLPGALLCALLAILFYGLGQSRVHSLERSDEAILLQTATLRVSPTADGSVEAELTEGVKLYITDQVNSYVKVQLGDGRTGYLLTEDIGII
ncbi:hypothetical protein [Lewinella sp. IMCC34191]|uniref:hypothetical protein n=1 Tax=Lewinella sp. IMCC34191 TaxID=2259172 RepID=UPI000E270C79|nr:hypothetical protein [Lewinella sp. IMCC34191]